ncbi:MAG: tetratricopeptide repeat protein, partial [Bacteroidales bacterium]
MRKLKITKTSLGILFFLLSYCVQAQYTAFYKNPQARYRNAVELYTKEKYNAAKNQFKLVLKELQPNEQLMRETSLYYSAICDMRLYHKNGGHEMLLFIKAYPASNRLNDAYFELANYEYLFKNYSQAIAYYMLVAPSDLSKEERNDYYFRYAYANFTQKRYADAKLGFYEIKNGNSRYAPIAAYYYAYILYTEGSYETALKDFQNLENDENFGNIAPYYSLQIYYMQEKYDSVLHLAPQLLKNASPKRAAEIARLLGEAYYYTNQYAEALPYLKTYFVQSATSPTREDNYIMGYTYYKLYAYDTAVLYFQKAVAGDKKDALQQDALYLLGYCYIKQDAKTYAMHSFLSASKIDANEKIKEDAIYNYIKLSYELAVSPYTETISAFETYLTNYPDSKYKDEIYGYLVNMFMRTRNYQAALASIEKIHRKDSRLMEAVQRVSFNRGIELFYEKKYTDAMVYFDKAIEQTFHEWLNAQAVYWKGEALYRLGNFEQAAVNYEKFVYLSQTIECPDSPKGEYSFAYTLFQQKKYKEALVHFQNFLQQDTTQLPLQVWQDAKVRAGDAAFMLKEYQKAIQYYDLALQMKNEPLDYVYYQKALALGALGLYDEKIKLLRSFETAYPNSSHIASVINEMALTYLIMENNENAMRYYDLLANKYTDSPYSRMALLKQGLISFNLGQNEKALKTLEGLIAQYPASTEAKQALVSIRNIYISMNKVDEFFAFAKNLPNVKIEEGEQDSITFMASETKYMENDCPSARTGFANYLQKFPHGFFVLEAQYYLAECAYKMEEWEEARLAYQQVAEMPTSAYTEKALTRAAKLNFEIKAYDKALSFYNRLKDVAGTQKGKVDAYMGALRSLQQLKNYTDLITVAQHLLKMDGVSNEDQDEAHIYIARAAAAIGDYTLSLKEYKNLLSSKNSEYYAEANYKNIEAIVKDGKLAEGERL